MVEVFKTNIHKAREAQSIKRLLLEHFPDSRVDFDLEDCDKILRVETTESIQENIIELLEEIGYYCEELL